MAETEESIWDDDSMQFLLHEEPAPLISDQRVSTIMM